MTGGRAGGLWRKRPFPSPWLVICTPGGRRWWPTASVSPASKWRAGDLFLQRFAYSQSGDFLETGLYDFMTGERLGVENGHDAGALLRLLPK
ncbi:MAG: hypothetical protein M5U34_34530 [Chloroflexi bacterium]|nr:hypothetical protein [Chloroflexota bacterium]